MNQPATSSDDSLGMASPHILVVDDEPEFVALVSSWLTQADYQVSVAFSGEEALAMLGCVDGQPVQPEPQTFDLVLLDLMMPRMSGTEVCRLIRADVRTAQLPVLVLTALSTLEQRINALEAGANDYIVKPFEGVELLARVANLVRWRRAELEAQEKIRQRNRELNALNEVASTLNQTLALLDFLRQTLATVCHVTGFPWGMIHLLDHTGDCLELSARRFVPGGFLQGHKRIPRDDGLMWQVIEQMRPIATEFVAASGPGQDRLTIHCVLLAAQDQPLGLLTVGRDGPQALSAELAQLLGAMGHQIGSAVANARLFERLQRRSHKLADLNQVMGLITSRLDLSGVLSAIVEGLVTHWHAALARVWLCEIVPGDREGQEEQVLVLRASAGLSTALDGSRARLSVGAGCKVGQVAARRRAEMSIELAQDKAVLNPEWVRREGLCCFVGYPLLQGDRLLGVMAFFSREVVRQSDFSLLHTLAHQATVAIENARLYAREQRRVAELTALTQDLERSQSQLIQSAKMAATGRLAASLAHEINNPLQAIHNCLTLTQRFSLETKEHTEFLKLASEEVERLISIVQRILEFCRPSRGNLVSTDVNALIEHVVALTRKKLQYGDIELRLNLTPNLPAVSVVADQISQVILNLVINAIEAMPEGGPLEIASQQIDGSIEISVRDYGPGLDEEQVARIFEPFFTTKLSGTGLGLAISFGIVERHGGSIGVSSSPGAGAVFSVRLPVAPENERIP